MAWAGEVLGPVAYLWGGFHNALQVQMAILSFQAQMARILVQRAMALWMMEAYGWWALRYAGQGGHAWGDIEGHAGHIVGTLGILHDAKHPSSGCPCTVEFVALLRWEVPASIGAA